MLFLHHIDETNQIDGNLLTIFDYYSFYQAKGIDCKIVLFIPSICFINFDMISTVIDRYKNNIEYTCIDEHNLHKLLTLPYTKCFLSDRTYYELSQWKKEVCINKYIKYVYRTWFSFKHYLNFQNAIVLNEVSELGDVTYKRKIYFEGIKNGKKKDTALVLANGQRYLTEYEIDEILERYQYKIYLIANYPIENKHPRLKVYNTVKKNLFDFETFIYTANDYDYAPRMLLESIYLDKKIEIYKMPTFSQSERFQTLYNKDILKNYSFTDQDIF